MPNETYGGGIYLSSLILSRHWGFELTERGSRVWIYTKISADCEERKRVLNRFDLKKLVARVNSGIKSLLSRNGRGMC
jgi:hypothetical protein